MRLPGWRNVQRSGRKLRGRLSDHALILGYHRIAPNQQDPYRICVSLDHFVEQMEIIKRRSQAISLNHMTEYLLSGDIPNHKIVLTFDDGYRDIFQNVRPILEKNDIPATVFIITGLLGQVFWWDRLETALSVRSFDMEQLAENTGLEIKKNDVDSDSYALLLSLYRKLMNLEPGEREMILSEVELMAGLERPGGDQSCRSMTADEIVQLTSSSPIEVGSHSKSHPWLAKLPLEEQCLEISNSKSELEEIISKPVKSFSYPNGSVSKETAALVEQSGFRCACESTPDIVFRNSSRFQLPRLWVPDVGGEEFDRWLSGW